MKCVTIPLFFALHASAAILRRSSPCCFQLSATGHTTGPLSQLSDGQNRIGGGSSPATYCINKDAGTITDSTGRGCILTSPTSQFQCDTGATPSTGFSIDSGGNILHSGSASFYACPATSGGEYNIYTTPVTGQKLCVPIGLNTGGQCVSSSSSKVASPAASTSVHSAPAPSVPAPSAPAPSAPATSVAASSAPAATIYPAPSGGYPAPSGGYPAPSGGYPAPPAASSAPSVHASPASSTAAAPSASPSINCQAQENACRTAPNANQAFCSAQRAGCDGYIPGQGYISSTAAGSSAPATSVASKPSSSAAPVASKPLSSSAPVASQPSSSAAPVAPEPSSSAAPVASKPSSSADSVASSKVCPTDLSGAYQYPHLMIPVDSTKPNTALGNTYHATMNTTASVIYNFDIPSSYAGKTCQLEFLFPTQDKLQTSSYSMTGSGAITFYLLNTPASSATTFNSKSAVYFNLGTISATPGSSSIIGAYACQPGTYGILASGSGSLALSYFQDYNPAPIGLYVAAC